jgi:ubiquinone/menaquinone biosynthesis C-methylase UbiE
VREGRVSRHLGSLGHQVVGIDASPAMVHLAAAHKARQPALVADAARLPFSDGAFDLVVAYMALHDIDDMPGAVAEIGRALEAAGLRIEAIREPLPGDGILPGHPAERRWTRIPLFLHFRAAKRGD